VAKCARGVARAKRAATSVSESGDRLELPLLEDLVALHLLLLRRLEERRLMKGRGARMSGRRESTEASTQAQQARGKQMIESHVRAIAERCASMPSSSSGQRTTHAPLSRGFLSVTSSAGAQLKRTTSGQPKTGSKLSFNHRCVLASPG